MPDREIIKLLPGQHQAAGVSRRTWRRWLSGQARIPASVVTLARILVLGSLGEIDPAWSGWNLAGGQLVDPHNETHTPGQVRAWRWTAQQLQALRAEDNQRDQVRRLKTGNDGVAVTLELHRRLKDQ